MLYIINISPEMEVGLRGHGYIAWEWEQVGNEEPPAIGVRVIGNLKAYHCACNLDVASVRTSRRLTNTYIVLLKLIGGLPNEQIIS